MARERFDTKVLARVPSPGYPALSLVDPATRTIYVGTFTNAQGEDSGPSKVFAFAPDGQLDREFTIEGQTPGEAHGVQVAQIDDQNRLYLLDQHPARVVLLDPATGKQSTYGTFKDVPPCPRPSRRYSTFQAANPRRARSAQAAFITRFE